jgi:pilus assembly protein CpaE
MRKQKFSVNIKAKSRELGKELERIVKAAGGLWCNDPKERPDLLIFELSENFDDEFKLLESLIATKSVGEVFVTSQTQDTELLLKAMRTGTKEFLSQPISESEVKTALEAFQKRMQLPSMKETVHNGQVIHLIGAKGGVGTTTVAVNLAMILAGIKNAGSVALMDLNTVFGEIPLFLSVKPTYHWGQIAKNVGRLDSTFLLNAMAKHASGVHILPPPSYLNGHPPLTTDIMERLLSAMKNTFDFVVIDGGQSLDGPALKAVEMSEKILLITLLSLPCLNNTKNLMKSLAGLGEFQNDKLRLVINRYLKKSDISIKEAEESVQSEIFWNIPNDYRTTMSAINRGMPLHDISPKAGITKNLVSLVDALIESEGKTVGKKGWRFFKR